MEQGPTTTKRRRSRPSRMASMARRAETTVAAARSERGWRAFTSSGDGMRSREATFRFSVCCMGVSWYQELVTLLHASSIGLAFGSRSILDGLTLTIEEGERVGLVGVNGSGKSSLLRILARAAEPDRGAVQLRRGASVTYLPQEPEFHAGATVASELEVARAPLRAAIDAHAALSARIAAEADPERHDRMLVELAVLSDRVEHLGGWDTSHEARRLLDRLGVPDWDRPVSELSGGARKRVAIARALLSRPDLLLLDEPTNHLDADTVDWLEDELDGRSGALVLVTHDRYFLDDLVDRIVEITPDGGVQSWPGNYEAFLEQKLVAEEQGALSQHKRERWISQEVAWLRRGVEARRTKSKARIQRARALMAEKGYARPGVADLRVAPPPRLSQVVLEAHGLEKAFGERKVLAGVDFILQRGERVGIVGPNGAGKTTFLRLLLGELEPGAWWPGSGRASPTTISSGPRSTRRRPSTRRPEVGRRAWPARTSSRSAKAGWASGSTSRTCSFRRRCSA